MRLHQGGTLDQASARRSLSEPRVEQANSLVRVDAFELAFSAECWDGSSQLGSDRESRPSTKLLGRSADALPSTAAWRTNRSSEVRNSVRFPRKHSSTGNIGSEKEKRRDQKETSISARGEHNAISGETSAHHLISPELELSLEPDLVAPAAPSTPDSVLVACCYSTSSSASGAVRRNSRVGG